jgi:alpha-tubulin suppressor-like RCC1 family protein
VATLSPTPVEAPKEGLSQLAVGTFHACGAVGLNIQTAYCWGSNDNGQLGDGTKLRTATPTMLAGLTHVSEVSVTEISSCALVYASNTTQNTVLCWGSNYGGILGDGTAVDHLTPAPVPGLKDILHISSSWGHVCALGDTVVRCWGDNRFGQLGDGTTTGRNVPTLVEGLTDVAQVAAGQSHTCARLNNGGVWCWGANGSNQLGTGAPSPSEPRPVQVSGIDGSNAVATDIAVGGNHSCAVLKDGTILCWGDNSEGQLGDGTTQSPLKPTTVAW